MTDKLVYDKCGAELAGSGWPYRGGTPTPTPIR